MAEITVHDLLTNTYEFFTSAETAHKVQDALGYVPLICRRSQ